MRHAIDAVQWNQIAPNPKPAMPQINLLAVSVGNTRTRLGVFLDGELREVSTFRNGRTDRIARAIEQAYQPLHGLDDAHVIMSSVNPEAGEAVLKLLNKQLDRTVYRVEKDLPIPIGRQLDPEAIVGEDRLLNAAAAFDKLGQACVVVDAGTAMTIDYVDGAGTFHGGAIVPGAQLMLDALHQRTALLPEVEFEKPEELIGHNTAQAMLTGAFFGLRGIVRSVVEQYAVQTGQYPTVVATGGDAQVLFRDDEFVSRVVPDLGLRGIAVTLRKQLEQGEASA
ncbi:MAG: type III pantothenate kinase [Phycisphaeraceae bacterium]